MEITRKRLIIIVFGAVVIVIIGIHLFLYRPLMSKLKIQHLKCRTIESEANQAQKAIAALKKKDKKTILNESDVSIAIDELTRLAKSKGLNLISITPKQVKEKEALYKILPIEMEVGSTYEDLGIFLGSLDKLEKCVVTIESFNIVTERIGALKLKTKLVIDMYLAREQD